jgi:hypothetical protein
MTVSRGIAPSHINRVGPVQSQPCMMNRGTTVRAKRKSFDVGSVAPKGEIARIHKAAPYGSLPIPLRAIDPSKRVTVRQDRFFGSGRLAMLDPVAKRPHDRMDIRRNHGAHLLSR